MGHKGATQVFKQLEDLIKELEERKIPADVESQLNFHIDGLNQFKGNAYEVNKCLKSTRDTIIKILTKELNLVPANYYMLIWIPIGMSAFGLSIGVAIGMVLDNLALMGAFLPIGMVLGMAIGKGLDAKAQKEGRQLNLNPYFQKM